MTIGEIALWIKGEVLSGSKSEYCLAKGVATTISLQQYRASLGIAFTNMPTGQTAVVYPGTVLAEALNISEGRGTTIPF